MKKTQSTKITPTPIRVSIGIPAYNEAGNIGRLLRDLLAQTGREFELTEIIVASDGSSDDTAKIVKSFTDPRIRLIDSRARLGKTTRMNQLLHDFNGDVLMLLDADISIPVPHFIAQATRGFKPNHGLVGVNATPIPGRTFIERCLESGMSVVERAAHRWDNGSNYLAFRGACLILGRDFARQLKLPAALVTNDAYLFFCARQFGFTPQYRANVRVYFRAPSTLRDHIRQSQRFQYSAEELGHLLKGFNAEEAYQVPSNILFPALLAELRRRPLYLLGYIGISVYARLIRRGKPDTAWEIASSTKNISTS